MKRLLVLLFVILATPAFADFTIILDAGQLKLNATTPMPAGSVLVLVAAGGDGTFSNSLAPGQYVSGNDILLSTITVPNSAAGFNSSGGTNETLNLLTISTTNFPTLGGRRSAGASLVPADFAGAIPDRHDPECGEQLRDLQSALRWKFDE